MPGRPLIVGIAGGSGAGKTTFSTKLRDALGHSICQFISQDNYYIDQSDKFTEDGGDVNFDDPSALEFTLLERHLADLSHGRTVDIPIYDFASHTRSKKTMRVQPAPVILVDGTLILSKPASISHFDIRIFNPMLFQGFYCTITKCFGNGIIPLRNNQVNSKRTAIGHSI